MTEKMLEIIKMGIRTFTHDISSFLHLKIISDAVVKHCPGHFKSANLEQFLFSHLMVIYFSFSLRRHHAVVIFVGAEVVLEGIIFSPPCFEY